MEFEKLLNELMNDDESIRQLIVDIIRLKATGQEIDEFAIPEEILVYTPRVIDSIQPIPKRRKYDKDLFENFFQDIMSNH